MGTGNQKKHHKFIEFARKHYSSDDVISYYRLKFAVGKAEGGLRYLTVEFAVADENKKMSSEVPRQNPKSKIQNEKKYIQKSPDYNSSASVESLRHQNQHLKEQVSFLRKQNAKLVASAQLIRKLDNNMDLTHQNRSILQILGQSLDLKKEVDYNATDDESMNMCNESMNMRMVGKHDWQGQDKGTVKDKTLGKLRFKGKRSSEEEMGNIQPRRE